MKIALVGNPNSGKTTLFNLLTGMNAKIGNWPGVTIEKKSGTIKNTTHEIVDLPGIYSLSPYTEEEKVARAFIFNESPDLIINIVDATSLERSLYLTTQLLELGIPVLIALNMADMLPKRGLKIDIQKLSYELKTEVIQISALKATGIQDLIFAIDKTKAPIPYGIYDANIENSIIKIINNLPSNLLYKRFVAVKILEEDKYFSKYNFPILFDIIKETSHNYDTDLEEIVATERYNYIERVREICINKIAQEMKFYNEEYNNFNENEYREFYGVYYGQLGKNVEPDTIKYLTNDTINNAVTYNYETNKESTIYDKTKADSSMDKYDLFLSGSTPIIEIRNKEASTDKELIIFRDSFGSSIAPLFTQAYKKITLIDTRYISSDLISNYVSFSNQDVLFLYSTLIINESGTLK